MAEITSGKILEYADDYVLIDNVQSQCEVNKIKSSFTCNIVYLGVHVAESSQSVDNICDKRSHC